jgi:hypothetical protein
VNLAPDGDPKYQPPPPRQEKPINWANDPDAIVEDDEPQIGRDYA